MVFCLGLRGNVYGLPIMSINSLSFVVFCVNVLYFR